ncbi:MAG: hypothetical protein H6828_09455 [Planctomycetes bacterium]|nr:hypothetical protein [Planctomycetota bacterium]
MQLLARVDGRASAVRELEARPGEQELRVELALECGLALEFRDGAARVPFDEGARLALRDAAGAPVPPSWDSHGTLFLPAPGAYRLDVTGFAGFEDVRDLAVRLERTGFEPWRVDLVRRP